MSTILTLASSCIILSNSGSNFLNWSISPTTFLDNLIDQACSQPGTDQVAMQRLKKRRLLLRDQIARLEAELGVALFTRPGRSIRLTRHGRALLEASGGVTLDTVRDLARTGVHRISVGALTHSAPVADVALELSRAGARA